MMILADDFETAEIEEALEDIKDLLERRRDEGRSTEAYSVAILLMADAVCDENEPRIN